MFFLCFNVLIVYAGLLAHLWALMPSRHRNRDMMCSGNYWWQNSCISSVPNIRIMPSAIKRLQRQHYEFTPVSELDFVHPVTIAVPDDDKDSACASGFKLFPYVTHRN